MKASLPIKANVENGETNPFYRKITGKWSIVLLEQGTCCYRAGQYFAGHAFSEHPNIIEVSSFDTAIKTAKADNRIILLPHIHRISGDIETDYRWRSMDDWVFGLENPSLYLASKSNKLSTQSGYRCATIERLESLVDMSETPRIQEWVNVENTQQAARACAVEKRADLCITNEYGLNEYRLLPLRQLKQMTVYWLPYQWCKQSSD